MLDGFVTLPTKNNTEIPGPISATAGASGYGVKIAAREFAEALALNPEKRRMGTVGFEITARSDFEILGRHELKIGDVLLEIDEKPMAAARIETLVEELGSLDAVEVTFERNGQVRSQLLMFDRR